MNKYLVCMKESGQGCDYSIACGMHFEVVSNGDISDVIQDTLYPDGEEEENVFDQDDIEEILIVRCDEMVCLTRKDL